MILFPPGWFDQQRNSRIVSNSRKDSSRVFFLNPDTNSWRFILPTAIRPAKLLTGAGKTQPRRIGCAIIMTSAFQWLCSAGLEIREKRGTLIWWPVVFSSLTKEDPDLGRKKAKGDGLQGSRGLTADIEMTHLSGMNLLFSVSVFTVSLQVWVATQVIDILLVVGSWPVGCQ